MRPAIRSGLLVIVPVCSTLIIILISPHVSAELKLEVVAGVLLAVGGGGFGGWAVIAWVKRIANREAGKIAQLGS